MNKSVGHLIQVGSLKMKNVIRFTKKRFIIIIDIFSITQSSKRAVLNQSFVQKVFMFFLDGINYANIMRPHDVAPNTVFSRLYFQGNRFVCMFCIRAITHEAIDPRALPVHLFEYLIIGWTYFDTALFRQGSKNFSFISS